MIEISKCQVFNYENAIRGARNPMNSWGRMDSSDDGEKFTLDEKDLGLKKKLCKSRQRPPEIFAADICIRGYYSAFVLVEGI